jgi:hypothetical protein
MTVADRFGISMKTVDTCKARTIAQLRTNRTQ